MASSSSFGWHDSKKCVTTEQPVWDAYLAVHKEAIPFVNRPFPMYNDLLLIFGKDRAIGKDAQGPLDMLEDLDREREENRLHSERLGDDELDCDGDSMSFAQRANPCKGGQSEESSAQKMKRKNCSNELASSIVEAAKLLKSAMIELSQALGLNMSQMRKKINEELSKTGLTMMERHRALRIIGIDLDLIETFFTVPDDEKEAFVRSLLQGEI